ncbi:MAG: hypothetical protein KatS3mg045_0998 [Bellilinea sp.]|nr:MAG: hypothetical protein KatS3mg045_0998 [Bellilinea sp.]
MYLQLQIITSKLMLDKLNKIIIIFQNTSKKTMKRTSNRRKGGTESRKKVRACPYSSDEWTSELQGERVVSPVV